MDKYSMYSFLLNILIFDKPLVCDGKVGWGTRDPRWVIGMYRLVGSRVVLLYRATLGHFLWRAKQWACVGVGFID